MFVNVPKDIGRFRAGKSAKVFAIFGLFLQQMSKYGHAKVEAAV